MTFKSYQRMEYEMYPLGEQAVVIRWECGISEQTRQEIQSCLNCLERNRLPELIEIVAAYRTLTVYYDAMALFIAHRHRYNRGRSSLEANDNHSRIGASGLQEALAGRVNEAHYEEFPSPYELMCSWIRSCLSELEGQGAEGDKLWSKTDEAVKVKQVPVCFSGVFGPDLESVASHAHLQPEDAIQLYCSAVYVVHMVGFLPGFPYLGGLPERLAMPRRSVPRLKIPAGSVGIAGSQTGIYPLETPGGWQVIGRTPLKLFDAERSEPSWFQAGDYVQFVPVPVEEYLQMLEEAKAWDGGVR